MEPQATTSLENMNDFMGREIEAKQKREVIKLLTTLNAKIDALAVKVDDLSTKETPRKRAPKAGE